MTPVDRPSRAARGRVLLVGGPARPPESPPIAGRVVRADNLFDAVGEVTVATAAEPVDAVVVPADLVRRSAALTVEAFRRIDPSVRLFLLAASDDEAATIDPDDGFDGVLIEPLASAQLADVLHHDDDGSDNDHVSPPPRRNAAPEVRAPAPDERLGDTDLVEAIMTEPAGLRDRALQLIRQQTRWSDVELLDSGSERDGDAAVEVAYGPRSYGVLRSSEAGAERLRPWARWLGRWLALDAGYRDFRTKAFADDLTGAGNRRFYDIYMTQTLRKAARSRRAVTVLVFDIDNFKRYNDEFGHEAGDDILRETVRLLQSVIRPGDRVCRIGGDEFVVIFGDPEGPREVGSNPPETVETIAVRFQEQICRMKFPKLGLDAPGTLSVSGGLATYPWDGTDPESLLRHADQLALESKRRGKNVITIGKQLT